MTQSNRRVLMVGATVVVVVVAIGLVLVGWSAIGLVVGKFGALVWLVALS